LEIAKFGRQDTEREIIPNYEFYSILLGYGKKLLSVSPEFVREEMQKI
jgi:hypothetical protein